MSAKYVSQSVIWRLQRRTIVGEFRQFGQQHDQTCNVQALLAFGERAAQQQVFNIATVLSAIEPAVKKTKGQAGDPVENAVRAQALDVAKQLQEAKPILAEQVKSGKIKIVAGRYDLESGKIDLLSP